MSTLMSSQWVSVPIKNDEEVITGYRPMRYDQFVLKLFKKEDEYKMLSHMTRGVCTEAGEITDVINGQELNLKNLIEELGDMKFYIQAIQNFYGLTDDVVLQHNALKLSDRYLNLEYSDEQAKLRRDKNGD